MVVWYINVVFYEIVLWNEAQNEDIDLEVLLKSHNLVPIFGRLFKVKGKKII